MADLLKFSIPQKPEYVGLIRLAVSSAANCAGFDIEAIEDIKVAVAEACTNVICHGNSGDYTNFEIECQLERDRMIISVQDKGQGYNVEDYSEPDLDNPREGGLGLFIIKSLMDEVDIFSRVGEGTKLQMIKYI